MKSKVVVDKSSELKESLATNRVVTAKVYHSPKKGNTTRSNVEFHVNAMKVADLRKELKLRDCDANGLKKDLRARLLEAMFQELESQQNETTASITEPLVVKVEPPKQKAPEVESSSNSHTIELIGRKQENDERVDKESYDVSNSEAASGDEKGKADTEGSGPRPAKVSYSSTQAETHSVVESESAPPKQESVAPKEYWKNLSKASSQSEASVATGYSSIKKARSPIRAVVAKAAFKAFGIAASAASSQAFPMEVDTSSDAAPEEDISPPASEVSTSSKISGTRVRELVSKISNSSNFSSSTSALSSTLAGAGTSALSSTLTGGNASALSKNLQAKKEARLAKMAEMRNKSKPLTTSTKAVLTPKDYSTTVSLLNATGGATSVKKKNLAAQMREKAAANAAFRKENVPANQSSLTSTGKRNLQSSQCELAPDPLGGTIKQGFTKKAKVASPLDTYEISDREDSDTDDSDESDAENEKKKKKVSLGLIRCASSRS